MLDFLGQWIGAEIPGAALGEVCTIESAGAPPLEAEVVGFEQGRAMLLPYGDPTGLRADAKVEPSGAGLSVRWGKDLRGVVLDGLGRPYPAYREPFERHATESLAVGSPVLEDRSAAEDEQTPRIGGRLSTGIRAIDGCITLSEGQRIGLLAENGVGAMTLMGRIACNSAVDVVVVFIDGVSGREVRDFVEFELEPEGLARTVVVATRPTDPALVRVRGAFVAQRIAEAFRDSGQRVLLVLMDLRGIADAQDEVGRLLGETPSSDGLVPSARRTLASLFARAGNSAAGSITAIYALKVYGLDATNERLTPFLWSQLDGNIVLSRALALRNHWPAIDVPLSISRLMNFVVEPHHKDLARRMRRVIETFERNRPQLEAGQYRRGKDPALDEAVSHIEAVNAFLQQRLDETSSLDETVAAMERIFAS